MASILEKSSNKTPTDQYRCIYPCKLIIIISTYNIHHLLHSLEFLPPGHFWRQPHVSREGKVLTDRQFLVIGRGQLEDVPSTVYVLLSHLFQRITINVYVTLWIYYNDTILIQFYGWNWNLIFCLAELRDTNHFIVVKCSCKIFEIFMDPGKGSCVLW